MFEIILPALFLFLVAYAIGIVVKVDKMLGIQAPDKPKELEASKTKLLPKVTEDVEVCELTQGIKAVDDAYWEGYKNRTPLSMNPYEDSKLANAWEKGRKDNESLL